MFLYIFGYILFLILPPIHSSPYTFFPLYVLPPIHSSPYQKRRIFPYLLIPQKNTMPLFLKAWIPKENPFKTLRGLLPHKAYKYVFIYFWLYTVPDSSPYTFFPLYILPPIHSSPYQKRRIFPYLLIPQKNTMPLFLRAWIPKENPFKTLRGLLPHKAYKYVFIYFWLYTVPDSSPYTFSPLYILPPIRSSPYTFFPLSKKANFSISFNTPKEYHAPFLKGMDPQRKPF